MVDLAAEHLEAARALDVTMAAARAASARLDDARVALEDADRARHNHNGAMEAESRTNPILAAMHRSVWPNVRTVSRGPVNFGWQLRAELVTTTTGPWLEGSGARDTVVLKTAEDVARTISALLPVPATAAA